MRNVAQRRNSRGSIRNTRLTIRTQVGRDHSSPRIRSRRNGLVTYLRTLYVHTYVHMHGVIGAWFTAVSRYQFPHQTPRCETGICLRFASRFIRQDGLMCDFDTSVGTPKQRKGNRQPCYVIWTLLGSALTWRRRACVRSG